MPDLGRAGALLWLMVVGLATGTFVVSAIGPHLWMTRNLLVVQPALSWALVLTAWLLVDSAELRVRLAVVGVMATLLVAQGVGAALTLQRSYKPDVRALTDFLVARQRANPDLLVAGFPAYPWPAPLDTPAPEALSRTWASLPEREPWTALPRAGPSGREAVYFVFVSPYGADPEPLASRMLAAVDDGGRCSIDRRFVGFAVVTCPASA